LLGAKARYWEGGFRVPVFLYQFDEKDGFFDHMVPPTPPQSRAKAISTVGTTNELFTGSSYYPATSNTPGP
jgi:phospholipase C